MERIVCFHSRAGLQRVAGRCWFGAFSVGARLSSGERERGAFHCLHVFLFQHEAGGGDDSGVVIPVCESGDGGNPILRSLRELVHHASLQMLAAGVQRPDSLGANLRIRDAPAGGVRVGFYPWRNCVSRPRYQVLSGAGNARLPTFGVVAGSTTYLVGKPKPPQQIVFSFPKNLK